ncbi:serine/threonine-protein kinase [Streptomyces griseoviridis]
MEKLRAGDPPRIGAYRLLGRLGGGGMGQVYLARSDRGRTVAVKLVRGDLAAREEFRARFRQEVRAARQVGGCWTAPVLDADTEAPVPWVATGYVAGPSLQQVVGRDHGALPERSVRILAAGLAQALMDIHAAGIVHRDLKPSNVLVTIDGPRVIDFGIARALETVTDGGLTRTGALVGSPGFMAPEQVRGDPITPACDIFCLGSVLAFAATGRLPFGSASSGAHALMFRIAQEEPDLTGVPETLADLVRACLRKDPAARPVLHRVLERTGAEDTVEGGRLRDPWLPAALVAQLGRHAVRLLDTEDPTGAEEDGTGEHGGNEGKENGGGNGEGRGPGSGSGAGAGAGSGSGAGSSSGSGAGVGGGSGSGAGGEVPPEHGSAPDSAPPPQGDGTPSGPPPAAGWSGTAPAPAAHPAYGIPHQHPQQPQPNGYGHGPGGYGDGSGNGYASGQGATAQANGFGTPTAPGAPGVPPAHATPVNGYGYPHGHGSLGATPADSSAGYTGPLPSSAPAEPPRRDGRSTAALLAVALVVAIGAGGSVYALLNGGGATGGTGPSPSASAPATPGGRSPQPSAAASSSPSGATDGAVPSGYLGTWTATITNADGENTRTLTLRQGKVGDTVLSLVAEGPTAAGGYRCVFEAELTRRPGAQGPLEIGPSLVRSGDSGACTPGAPTEIRLLPDGRLERVNTKSGEKLAYSRG